MTFTIYRVLADYTQERGDVIGPGWACELTGSCTRLTLIVSSAAPTSTTSESRLAGTATDHNRPPQPVSTVHAEYRGDSPCATEHNYLTGLTARWAITTRFLHTDNMPRVAEWSMTTGKPVHELMQGLSGFERIRRQQHHTGAYHVVIEGTLPLRLAWRDAPGRLNSYLRDCTMHAIHGRTRDSQQWVKFAEFKSFNKALKMTYKVANKYPQPGAWIKT